MAYGDVIGWPGSLHDALNSFLMQDFSAPKAHFRPQSLRYHVQSWAQRLWGREYLWFRHATGPDYLLRCSRQPKRFGSRTETFALSREKSDRTCRILLARVPKFRSGIPKMDVLCMRFNWTHVTCQVTRTSSPIWGHLGNPRWMITWDFPKPDGKAKEKRFDVEMIEIYYEVRQRVYLYPWCNRPKGQCGSRFSEYIFCWPRNGGGVFRRNWGKEKYSLNILKLFERVPSYSQEESLLSMLLPF